MAQHLSPDRPAVDRATDPLVDLNLDDLLDALGLSRRRGGVLLRPLLRPAARHFGRTVRAFDDRVGAHGLAAGSAWLVQRMAGGLQVAGRRQLPASGPLLVLANHPGMTDTVALFAALAARTDLRVIAHDRAFLRALPHVSARVEFVAEDARSRTQVLRAGVAHLRQGGALLTFPAGAIEPDPVAEGAGPAVDALQAWSSSFALFARAVPQARIATAVVSQVVSARALRHPLTRFRAAAADRAKLAAALQILWPPYQALAVRVAFSVLDPVPARDAAALRAAVLAHAATLMVSPPAAWEALTA